MPRLLLAAAAMVALASAACGSGGKKPPSLTVTPVVQTGDVERLIEQGCYRCLERAFSMARARGLSELAFEAAALLTLRTGELGITGQTWLQTARDAAAGDSVRAQYLEMVAVVPGDPLSGQRDDLLVETQSRRRAEGSLAVWRELLRSGGGSVVFRQYLALTLACQVDTSRERETEVERILAAMPAVPLLQYRAGTCGARFRRDNVETLRLARDAESELVDADYALGKYALADPEAPDEEEALRRFQSAASAFPTSVAIAVSLGNLYQRWEEWTSALMAFDTALAVMPAHPDALLGRTISLSQLQQHPEAIAAATQLIDGGRWYLGQAFYWRAWNHFNAGDNAAARSDADRTRSLMVNSTVFLLSGLIEWRAPRLPSAEKEFEQSVAMDFGQCFAALYLGGVRAEQAKVPEAIAALQQARQCFDLNIAVHRAAIEKLNAGPASAAAKRRGVAREERLIADAERRKEQATKTLDALQRRTTQK
jgi:tetratricopeptide (TPR) repeat protein